MKGGNREKTRDDDDDDGGKDKEGRIENKREEHVR